jgi:hypothetical protein
MYTGCGSLYFGGLVAKDVYCSKNGIVFKWKEDMQIQDRIREA